MAGFVALASNPWAQQAVGAGISALGGLFSSRDRDRNIQAINEARDRHLGLASTFQTKALSIPNYTYATNEALAEQGRGLFSQNVEQTAGRAKARLGRAYSGLNRGSTALARGVSQIEGQTQDAMNQYDYQFEINEQTTREERSRYIQALKDQYMSQAASILSNMQTPIIAPRGGGMAQLGSTLFGIGASRTMQPLMANTQTQATPIPAVNTTGGYSSPGYNPTYNAPFSSNYGNPNNRITSGAMFGAR